MTQPLRTRLLVVVVVVAGALLAATPAAARAIMPSGVGPEVSSPGALDNLPGMTVTDGNHTVGPIRPRPSTSAWDPDPDGVEPATWGQIKVQFAAR